ncbi:MAG: hypothetical protein MH472_03170 [Bacteroidia bacterium]|nr:hypothetical protein [Bacteroidia bacterium]
MNVRLEIKIGKTYHSQSFFNIRIMYNELIGANNEAIKLQLGNDEKNIITTRIDRTSNLNKTPRIYGGLKMKEWLQSNYKLNEVMIVEIINPHFLKIHPKQGTK